jgi:hypothetical protein
MTPSLRTVVALSWLVWPILKAPAPVTARDTSVGVPEPGRVRLTVYPLTGIVTVDREFT